MSKRLRYLYRAYRYRWRGDRAEIRFLCERLRSGMTAIDAGCFKGAYTYWMRRSVGPTGEVIAFEPQLRQVAYLRDVVATMRYANVAIEPMGLSNSPGKLRLYIPATGPGAGHGATFVAETAAAESSDAVDVAVTTLDAYFADRPRGPDFIKIDVEGHELAVVEGARGVLAARRPAILVECETRHRPDGDVRPVFDFFAELGYEGSFFQRGQRRPLAEFSADHHQQHTPGQKLPPNYVNNFAFEHPDGGKDRG
jgi:FkbM family methyltransferase